MLESGVLVKKKEFGWKTEIKKNGEMPAVCKINMTPVLC